MSIASPKNEQERRLSQAVDTGWDAAIEACIEAQPATAENPNEDTYQRGYFDGVMAYGKAILALKDEPQRIS